MSNTIESIEQGNKLIAEFMKNHAVNSPHLKAASEHKYHTNWEYIMPVVEKINKSGQYRVYIKFGANGTNGIYSCIIDKVEWINNYLEATNISGTSNTTSPIEVVWVSVVKFIEWYNNQKSNQ